MFGVFGPIKLIRMPPDTARPSKHRGYGYIEYENEQQCTDAVNAMNLFDLGGMYLRVCRVSSFFTSLLISSPHDQWRSQDFFRGGEGRG